MSTIASRATELILPTGGRIAILPTSVKDVVTISGSIIGGPGAFGAGRDADAALAASLLDAGAGKFSKEAFRNALAARGAELTFAASDTRLSFQASCFSEDAGFVIERIADALFSPKLPPKELASEKVRMLADLKDEASDTRSQADRAARRLIYPAGHPNHEPTFAEEERETAAATLASVKRITAAYGTKHLALAIVGDVDAQALAPIVLRAFKKAPAGQDRPKKVAVNKRGVERINISLPDKANADVVMAAPLGLTTDDPRYLPLTVVIHALGGSFASHLMQTVRERDGLTYGVRASLGGFGDMVEGYLRLWGTFAPQLLARGTDTLQKETALFLASGMDAAKLDSIKEEMAGSYAVSIATTQGLAIRIVRFMEADRPLSWLDEYPERVSAITLKEAQDAAALLASLPLSTATAGTL